MNDFLPRASSFRQRDFLIFRVRGASSNGRDLLRVVEEERLKEKELSSERSRHQQAHFDFQTHEGRDRGGV